MNVVHDFTSSMKYILRTKEEWSGLEPNEFIVGTGIGVAILKLGGWVL